MTGLTAQGLSKVFPDGTRALEDVSFTAPAGRVLALLGPSGCGKSTLLRIVAGLEEPTSGTLEMDGRPLLGIPSAEREVGFVFQNYALYPHLSVAGNLGLSLEVRKVPRPEREERVRAIAELLGISGLLGKRPGQLSGGQQQRVALGRALVRRPRLYLLDEPLSNLDALLRESTRTELKSLFRKVGGTVIYVTHDQAEAMSLADELAVMKDGRIVQRGSPLEVYRYPVDLFVATFVGSPRMNVWTGRRSGEFALFPGGIRFPVPPQVPDGHSVVVGIRPDEIEVSPDPVPGWRAADVAVTESLGSRDLLTLVLGETEARALAEPRPWSDQVWLRWPEDRLHWFDETTRARWPEVSHRV